MMERQNSSQEGQEEEEEEKGKTTNQLRFNQEGQGQENCLDYLTRLNTE